MAVVAADTRRLADRVVAAAVVDKPVDTTAG